MSRRLIFDCEKQSEARAAVVTAKARASPVMSCDRPGQESPDRKLSGLLQTHRFSQILDLVGLLPGEVLVLPAEMPIVGGVLVDRAKQV